MKTRRFLNIGACPECGSGRISVVSTSKPRRRHKCRVCGATWGTLELIESPQMIPALISHLLQEGAFRDREDLLPYLYRIAAASIS